jgi:hypothetical protein
MFRQKLIIELEILDIVATMKELKILAEIISELEATNDKYKKKLLFAIYAIIKNVKRILKIRSK